VVLWEGNESPERGCSTCGLIFSWVVVQCRFERCGAKGGALVGGEGRWRGPRGSRVFLGRPGTEG
jgi:hypothetical protein